MWAVIAPYDLLSHPTATTHINFKLETLINGFKTISKTSWTCTWRVTISRCVEMFARRNTWRYAVHAQITCIRVPETFHWHSARSSSDSHTPQAADFGTAAAESKAARLWSRKIFIAILPSKFPVPVYHNRECRPTVLMTCSKRSKQRPRCECYEVQARGLKFGAGQFNNSFEKTLREDSNPDETIFEHCATRRQIENVYL